MDVLASTINTAGFDRVELEIEGGVDVFAFERSDSPFAEWDYFFEAVDEAKVFCLERWGVPLKSWSPSVKQTKSS